MKAKHLLLLCVACLAACDLLTPQQNPSEQEPSDETPVVSGGNLTLRFLDSNLSVTKSGYSWQLDTNEFNLKVTASDGGSIYDGPWCEAPSSFRLDEGTYCVRAQSPLEVTPAFDAPQWGDEQCVRVEEGKSVDVALLCHQLNSGFRLRVDEDFPLGYPGGRLFLENLDGRLIYPYDETRYAYFSPGAVSLIMQEKDQPEEVLLCRNLSEGEMFSLKLEVTTNTRSGSAMTICVDTTRIYTSDTYVIGDQSAQKGSCASNAYTISQARSNVGATDVWVGGYIVGGDLTSKSMKVAAPFSASSNLAIGPKSNTDDKSCCLSVQLPSGSLIRDNVNLVDHPQMLGSYVYLKGDIVASYYGIPGLKNVSDYVFK